MNHRIHPRRFLRKPISAAASALVASITSAPALAGGVPLELPVIVVTGSGAQAALASSATEGSVTREQLEQRPTSRVGELMEFVPGLMVTQHSGEGKANQYFLRGFNLDHGTDFYTEVDGVPVNMRSHAHGQGYADMNFVIRDLVGALDYRKGPYFAEAGDFATAGSAQLRYVDSLPENIARVSVGEFGYQSALLAGSPSLLGGTLLLGGEASRYDGPFDLSQDIRKLSTVARYHQGDDRDGITASLMTYRIDYNAPDQIPLRAVEQGLIGRRGFIDPSDGGDVRRYSASIDLRRSAGETGHWHAQAYALRYRMDLYSNFTYFLNDPVNGDQFNQFDDRHVYGVNLSRYWQLPTPVRSDLTIGLQSRYDDIKPVGLYLTQARQRLSTVREDQVQQGSAALYVSSNQQWTPWLRSQVGLRADAYTFDVDSDNAQNSGNDRATLLSPKLALIATPTPGTRVFLNYGEGFHSNDARGVTSRIDPTDGSTPLQPVDALAKQRGAEIGVSTLLLPQLSLVASLWRLNSESELVYVGDAGNTEASGASRRRGVELAMYYSPLSWLTLDLDYAYARARLDSEDGNRIPNSIGGVFGAGLAINETRGWSGGLRLRYLGGGPLVEDNSARSPSTTVVNGQVGYRYRQRYQLSLQVLNLLDSGDNDITYFYESRLPGEPAEGVPDFHFHPLEPRQVRAMLSIGF